MQPVQRLAAGSLAMRSYSGMERQSAAATRVKKMHGEGAVDSGGRWWEGDSG